MVCFVVANLVIWVVCLFSLQMRNSNIEDEATFLPDHYQMNGDGSVCVQKKFEGLSNKNLEAGQEMFEDVREMNFISSINVSESAV